jgi:hypothetical protein
VTLWRLNVLKEQERLLLSITMKELPLEKRKTGVAEDEAIVSDEFGVVVYVHSI